MLDLLGLNVATAELAQQLRDAVKPRSDAIAVLLAALRARKAARVALGRAAAKAEPDEVLQPLIQALWDADSELANAADALEHLL